MTNPRQVTEESNKLTSDVWMWGSIPESENRIDVPVTLTLQKDLYERFMHLIHNDSELFREVVSSFTISHLKNWVGEFSHVCEPDVIADIVAVAMQKHMPLKQEA